jgi:CIC family chloride channel protein
MDRPEIKIGVLNDFVKLVSVSSLIGVVVALAFVALMSVYSSIKAASESFYAVSWIAVVVIPVVGVCVAYWLVKTVGASKETGGGSHRILEAYHFHGGYISAKDTLLDPFASAITIGVGGSAGFEGPSLLLGGGIGSLIARRFKVTPEEFKAFLLAGAAAGISAVFKAPLTGILFALEIPYKRDMARNAFIPATAASIGAYAVSISFLGVESLFPQAQAEEISLLLIGHSFAIGVLTAVVGYAFVAVLNFFKRRTSSLKLPKYGLPLLGGLIIGLTGLVLPQIRGVGYPTIEVLANSPESLPLLLLVALAVGKILLTGVTLRMGGSGGLFTPTIFIGAAVGAIYCSIIPGLNSSSIVMASMAALLAATNKTLLTSVAFVAETSGPATIITTLVAAATSYFLSQGTGFYEEIQPIDEYAEEEEMIGILYHKIEGSRNADALTSINVRSIMNNVLSVKDSDTIESVMAFVKDKSHREYPVIDSKNHLQGTITLEDILVGAEKNKRLTVGDITLRRSVIVTPETCLCDLVPALTESDLDNAWVVDDLKNLTLLGVVNETDVLKTMLSLI